MFKVLCTIVVVVAATLGVVGYWRGWYTVTTTEERIDISIDRKKVDADREAVSQQAKEKLDALQSGSAAPEGTPPVPAGK